MRFAIQATIDAPRAAVEAALADRAYYEHLGDSLATLESPELLEASVHGSSMTTRVRYAFAGHVSGPAGMVVDESKLTWVIETHLDLERHEGTVVVVPDHYDGLLRCSGELRLDEVDGTTTEHLTGDLDVSVPLIASKAEEAIIGGLTRHVELEADALTRFLAGR